MARAFAAVLFAASIAVSGCAVSPPTIAAPTTPSAFTGSWSVEWCDRTRPDLDCGGFSVSLLQTGDRICGEFGGALVNLRQVDEGSVVGRVQGDVAQLEVTSGRNGEVVRVDATRVGADLQWTQTGALQQGDADISVIATDELLKPTAGASTPAACAAAAP